METTLALAFGFSQKHHNIIGLLPIRILSLEIIV